MESSSRLTDAGDSIGGRAAEQAILTINAGSSSLQFSIYRIDDCHRQNLSFAGIVNSADKALVLVIKDASDNQAGGHTWDGECPEFSKILPAVLAHSEAFSAWTRCSLWGIA